MASVKVARRPFVKAVAIASAIALLSACAPSENQDAVTYTEPGWMAQKRQETEEQQAAWLTCLAEYGFEGRISLSGDVAVHAKADENGQLPPGVEQRIEEALETCAGRLPEPTFSGSQADEASYQRMLDTRACLINEGYEVPEPPSADVWIESVRAQQGAIWNPYQALHGEDNNLKVELEEFKRLNDVCPQSGEGMIEIYAPEA